MPNTHPEPPNVPLALVCAAADEAKRLIKHSAHDLAISARLYFDLN